MTSSQPEPDVVVVRQDDFNVVVQVKRGDGRKLEYKLPKNTLNVVFTANGVESTLPDEEEPAVAKAASRPENSDNSKGERVMSTLRRALTRR